MLTENKMTKTLYHVTRQQVARAIMKEGIRPKFATGKMIVSWYVELEAVVWGLAHVSARWSLSVDQLIVAEVREPEGYFRRWSTPGLWYAEKTIKPRSLWGYERFVRPEA